MSRFLPDEYYARSDQKGTPDAFLQGKVFKTPLSAVLYIEEQGYAPERFEILPVEKIYYASNVKVDFRKAGPPHDK